MAPPAPAPTSKRPRDERLDLFRGITMLIIFVAHVPANSWNAWIPARFGFSSGAELFVFCSGFASALAFGATFVRRGWWLGTARILQRLWQVYWAQPAAILPMLQVQHSLVLPSQHVTTVLQVILGALLGVPASTRKACLRHTTLGHPCCALLG